MQLFHTSVSGIYIQASRTAHLQTPSRSFSAVWFILVEQRR